MLAILIKGNLIWRPKDQIDMEEQPVVWLVETQLYNYMDIGKLNIPSRKRVSVWCFSVEM